MRAGAWLFSNFLLVPANTTDMGVLAGSAYPELWLNAWLSRCRRLSKDYEERTDSSEAWVRIAMVNLMLKRLKPA